jgi:hypothetical protein
VRFFSPAKPPDQLPASRFLSIPGRVAQLAEHSALNRQVEGSIPSASTSIACSRRSLFARTGFVPGRQNRRGPNDGQDYLHSGAGGRASRPPPAEGYTDFGAGAGRSHLESPWTHARGALPQHSDTLCRVRARHRKVDSRLRLGRKQHAPRIMPTMPGSNRVLWGALPAYAAFAVVSMAGCHRNISGSYLAGDNSAVVWLQIVRTPDDHLTGQLAANVVKPDGTIEQNSVSITGAVDGENVTIQGSRFFGLESFVLSGTLRGNGLTLTGAQSVPLTFTRSTPAEFQAKVAALNARSQSIIQAKAVAQAQQRTFQAQANFVSQVDQLIQRMAQFDSQADVHLGRFPGTEKGYQGITARVGAYVARERQLAGNPNAGVARGQLSVAANQASIQTEQMHNQGEALQSSLEADVKPMADESVTLEQQCRTIERSTGSLAPQEIENVKVACSRLENAVGPFRQKFSAMSAGLAHLEQVYQRERNTQQGLIQESERLE